MRIWRRRRGITGVAGAATAALAFLWVAMPIGSSGLTTEDWHGLDRHSAPTPPEANSPAPFDASVFQVQLWNAPARSFESVAVKPEPVPPPNLELIAIITESDRLVAALYEIGADRLHLVGAGERIGRLEIVGLDSGGVELRDGSRTFRLEMTQPPPEPGTRLTLGRGDEVQP